MSSNDAHTVCNVRCAVSRQETRDRREIFRYWFAPGVGLVRRSKYYADEEVFRQELIQYEVRPSTTDGRRAEELEIREALKSKKRGTEHRQDRKSGNSPDDPNPAVP